MSRKKKWHTAAEIMARLEKDPDYQRRIAEQDARMEASLEQYRAQEAPIVDELRAKGFELPSLWEATQLYAPLPDEMVEVLLDWLDKTSDLKLLDVLVGSLGAAAHPFDGRPLVRCYGANKDYNLQWVILDTIARAHPHSIDGWIEKIRQHPAQAKTLREIENLYRGKGAAKSSPRKSTFKQTPAEAGLVESSMNFDLEHVRPFLNRVTTLIESGFGRGEIENLVVRAEQMQPDDEEEWSFVIRTGGKPSTFRVRIFMSDVGAPDMYFFSKPALAGKIDAELQRFAEENDM